MHSLFHLNKLLCTMHMCVILIRIHVSTESACLSESSWIRGLVGNRALLSQPLFRNLLISYLILSGAQRILEHPLQSAIKTNEELLYCGLTVPVKVW